MSTPEDQAAKVAALEDERVRENMLTEEQAQALRDKMRVIEQDRTERADELRRAERDQAAESAAAAEPAEEPEVLGENEHPAPAVVGVSGAPDVIEEPGPPPEPEPVNEQSAPGIEGEEAGKSPEEAIHAASATTPPPTDEAGVTPFAKVEALTVETAQELTKAELVDRLSDEGVEVKSRATKSDLVKLAAHDFEHMTKAELAEYLAAQGKNVPAKASKADLVEMASLAEPDVDA